ncbi:MAG TPA: GH1 family beta-glucosidase [Mycobacteriales bacterium]|nr:GH1 family beta-glucosidase [Mycobacteriales bacterium]
MTTLGFPSDFLWGAATSAYQIEGAVAEDGRGQSIWDTFCRMPGKVKNGDTGDVAADHYHRYAEDVRLMSELGLRAYRLSVCWPRVRPDGRGPTNQRGLDFYRGLVDRLLAHGIEPVVTLYHWDLPQPLQDDGGWENRETAERFAEYAATVHGALGDRVRLWTTVNEPWCAAFLGYASGIHAPGLTRPAGAFAAAHHLLLGHGLAAQALRAANPGVRVSISLNLSPVRPAEPDRDGPMARRVDGLANRLFLDPILRGQYPVDVVEHARPFTDWGFLRDGDLGVIGGPVDALGVNYYHPAVIQDSGQAHGGPSTYPGCETARWVEPGLPVTTMGWGIEPAGLLAILLRLHQEYPAVPLLVTENGAAFDDDPGPDGQVRDRQRIRFLDAHLRAAHQAIERGVDLRGFFVWSLLDNFEWAEGYRQRFGLVHVDYGSQRRTPKDSARWYRDVIGAGGVSAAPPDEDEPGG